MSMTKTFGPDGWAFGDEPCARLVKSGREGLRGNDLRDFIKRAGHYLADVVRGLEFKPGEVPLHAIAVGSTEFFGVNKNGDGFREKACQDHHHTFEKYAKWFMNHQNKPTDKSYGLVKKSVYNPEMRRIELFVALNGNAEAARANGGHVAASTLEKLAANRPVGTSMSCKVAFDSCSFCGNKARNRDEYCTEKTCAAGGLKGNIGAVLKCGHVLHADNPEPVFFDISDVGDSPAERTAYVLGRLDKMAAESPHPTLAQIDDDSPSPLDVLFLTDAERLVKELIALEKIADFKAVAPALSQGQSSCVFKGTVSQALSSLAHRGQVLPPREWLSLVAGDHDKAASVAPLLAPLASQGLARLLRYPSYLEKASRFLSSGLGHQNEERFSLLEPDLRKRLLLASLHDEAGPTLSNQSLLVKSGSDLMDLAAHYSAYGVCALLLAERNHSVSRLTRCALLAQNRLVTGA